MAPLGDEKHYLEPWCVRDTPYCSMTSPPRPDVLRPFAAGHPHINLVSQATHVLVDSNTAVSFVT